MSEWFGALPPGWDTARIRYYFDITLGKMLNAGKDTDDSAVQAPYLAAGSIQPQSLAVDPAKQMAFTRAELVQYALRRDDIVVVEGGAGYGRSHLLRSDMPGWGFQNHVARVRATSEKMVAPYLLYCLRACLASGYIEANNRTATLPSLSRNVLGGIPVPLPPVGDQQAIADYLDRETAQIDTLIKKQQRLIDVLRERRRAVLDVVTSTAVGDPVRLRYLFAPSDAANHPGEEVLSVYRDYGVIPKASREDNFNRTPANVARYLLVRPGDLVVNRMKAWQGSLGISEHRGIVSGDYEVARPTTSSLLPRFAHLFLRSPKMIAEYAVRSTGIRPSQWRLYWDEMGNIEMPVPSQASQAAIVSQVDEQATKIDRLIAKSEQFIVVATERRTALITAAVTGQVDVRGAVKSAAPESVGAQP